MLSPVAGRFTGEVARPRFASFDRELDNDDVLKTDFTIPFKFLALELLGFNYYRFEFIPL